MAQPGEREPRSRYTRIRTRVHRLLEPDVAGDAWSRGVDFAIICLIGLNVAAMVIETVEPVRATAPELFRSFEIFSVLVFTIEYVLRLWSAPSDPRYTAHRHPRARWALTPLALADLLSVLPFYLPFLGADLRVFRAARLFRILRFAKLARYSLALQTFGRVVAAKKEELITTFVLLLVLLLLASSLLYFAENSAQPDAFSSIPKAMWWGIATLTTVGYGDVVPITGVGRVLASMIAIMGIGMFALPTGILGAAFVDEIQSRKVKNTVTCPHCGETFLPDR